MNRPRASGTAALRFTSDAPQRALACTRCARPMRALHLEGHYGNRVEADLCGHCHRVWFDAVESVRLSGLGWLALLREMDRAPPFDAAPRSAEPGCPRCSAPLKGVFDQSRFGRFTTLECPRGHGQFRGFAEILAERGLVRPLHPRDLQALREEGRTPACLNCGAPVEGASAPLAAAGQPALGATATDTCAHCASPLLLLDLPRLMASLMVRDGLALPDDGSEPMGWPCPSCGQAVDPSRERQCDQCGHAVLAPSLARLRPLFDSLERRLSGHAAPSAAPQGGRWKRWGWRGTGLAHLLRHALGEAWLSRRLPWALLAVGLVVLALAVSGCGSAAAPPSQPLRSLQVECRSGDAAAGATTQSAYDCVKAGGQYASADGRADLAAWLPLAKAGDAVAQTRVGLIYELGLAGGGPDYISAGHWYRQAVRAEFAPALVRYAGLVDRGLGVRRDPDAARSLLRRAGLGPAAVLPAPRLFLVQPSRVLADQSPEGGTWRTSVPRAALAAGLVGRATAQDERVRKVSVNGAEVTVDAHGYFTVPETALREAGRIDIALVDRRGQTARLAIDVGEAAAPRPAATLPAPSAQPAVAAPPTGQRHALLIANQDYRHLPRLATPAADVQALQGVLEERYGYRTRTLMNADRRAVLAALAELRARLGRDDELIVFYAGHGEIDEATERGYWLPVDARRDDRSAWISSVDVSDALLGMAARRVLLVIDSCFAGSFNRRALPGAQAELNAWANPPPPRSSDAPPRSRWAMTSGGLEPVADGGAGRHSIYAASLLEVLRGLQGPAPARRVVDEVHARFQIRAVRKGLDQRPRYAPVKEAGHQDGEFEFVPKLAT